MPTKHHEKYKLLLDEGLSPKNRYKNLNNYFDVKHIKHDLKKGAISDNEVYKCTTNEKRILVTFNIKDFNNLVKLNKPSIIALSVNLTNDQADKKTFKLLKKLKYTESLGHIISVSNSRTVIKRLM